MTLKANRDALIEAAAGWDGIGNELTRAYMDIIGESGAGMAFGWFAQRADIHTEHDTFIGDMAAALLDGASRMREMGDILRDIAEDFGATDVDVADTFHNPDGTPQ